MRRRTGCSARNAGRPKAAAEVERLIVLMARDNTTWGYTRIGGALYNLGHEIGRNTTKRVLLDNGIDPAPLRNKGMSWETLLKAHWSAISATDFFSVEVLTRNLTNVDDGTLTRGRYLIHNRDPLFTEAFRKLLRSSGGYSGVKTVKPPARSPNLNAYAERFARSIKSECLAQIVPLSERHLRNALNEYTEHYHFERNHQGLNNQLIGNPRDEPDKTGTVSCRERLGGVLNGE